MKKVEKMNLDKRNYHNSMTVKITAIEAFKHITNVSRWWTIHFKGKTSNINDEFTLRFGENWFFFRVTESIPGKKLVWQVLDCEMVWLNDRKEWKDTKIVWDISENEDGTIIDLTHIGLVPSAECYEVCNTGWHNYFSKSLPSLIETGKGILFDD